MTDSVCYDVPLPRPSRVAWSWGPSLSGHRVPQPMMGYYWTSWIAPDRPAYLLSATADSQLFEPGRAPTGRNANWDDFTVRAMVATLRAERGPQMNALKRPSIWEDMYQYFNAVDLRSMGAWNLWRALHFACDENDGPVVQSPLDDASRKAIEDWAYAWLTVNENRLCLGSWDKRSDILSVLPPADTQNIVGCDRAALNILRGILQNWYHYYQTDTTGHLANFNDARSLHPNCAHDGRCNIKSTFFNLPSVLCSLTFYIEPCY